MSNESETIRLDAGGPYLWRVGDIALKTVTSVCRHCDDIHLDMSLFLDGEHDSGTALEKKGKITLDPWTIVLEAGGGVPEETERKLTKLLDKYRDEITPRGERMLRGRDREQWRSQDLAGLKPGVLVRYRNLFPADFDLIFMAGERAHFLEDYFCLVAGCPCATVTTVVTALDDDDGDHRELGPVTFDLGETPLKLEGKKEAVEVLRSLLRETDVQRRLVNRHTECRRIAPGVARALGVGGPAKTATRRAKAGRNAPCPCGSGKKYKKCCLEKDSATR